jgi:hypothetical protein
MNIRWSMVEKSQILLPCTFKEDEIMESQASTLLEGLMVFSQLVISKK